MAPDTGQPVPNLLTRGPNSWRAFWWFCAFALIFWFAEFAYQYFILIPGETLIALERASALAGATLISAALLMSIVIKFAPRYAIYWRIRRFLGVSGVLFATAHVLLVTGFLNIEILALIFSELNPLINPALFGVIAYPIFFFMAITSTDYMVQLLTPRWWKMLHRLVYFGYASVVFHFVSMSLYNPELITHVPGFLLSVMIAATLAGQLYWFVRIAGKRRFLTAGALVGFAVVALYAIVGYLIWQTIVLTLF